MAHERGAHLGGTRERGQGEACERPRLLALGAGRCCPAATVPASTPRRSFRAPRGQRTAAACCRAPTPRLRPTPPPVPPPPHRDLAALVKRAPHVAQHEAGLADAAVSQQHELHARRRAAAARRRRRLAAAARARDAGRTARCAGASCVAGNGGARQRAWPMRGAARRAQRGAVQRHAARPRTAPAPPQKPAAIARQHGQRIFQGLSCAQHARRAPARAPGRGGKGSRARLAASRCPGAAPDGGTPHQACCHSPGRLEEQPMARAGGEARAAPRPSIWVGESAGSWCKGGCRNAFCALATRALRESRGQHRPARPPPSAGAGAPGSRG
jgi:hypothetical protein